MVLPLKLREPLVNVAVQIPPTDEGTVQVCEPLRLAVLPLTLQVRLQPLGGLVTTSPDDDPEVMVSIPFSEVTCCAELQVSIWLPTEVQLPM